jgi:hypothetical protein
MDDQFLTTSLDRAMPADPTRRAMEIEEGVPAFSA